MGTKLVLISAAAALSCLHLHAGEPSATELARLGLLKHASALLNEKVTDRQDHAVGKVQDLILDRQSRVVLVLVAARADQLTPVPARTYSDVSVNRLMMTVPKKVFANAPQIPRGEPLNSLTTETVLASYHHFQEPALQQPARAGRLASAARLLGSPVRNAAGEPLGRLKDMMVDLPLGRIIYYVVQPNPDLHAPGDFYVLPPRMVALKQDASALVVNVERARFLAGPYFQNDFWNDMALPALANTLARYYGAGSEDDTAPAQMPLPPALEPASPLLAEQSGQAHSDRAITQGVLSEIVQTVSGFRTITIAVNTVDGRVVLSGNVKTEQQRQQIVSAARKVVGPEKVEDRLAVGLKKTASL